MTAAPLIVPADSTDAIERAVHALRAGLVVGVPTETVYGLAVLPAEAPLQRLVAAKHRSADKGIAVLVDTLDQVRQLARVPVVAERLAAAFWPGPLTLVLPVASVAPLPELLTGGRPTIGVRLPDHPVPRALARLLGPIATSSANVSGEPDATTAEQVAASIGAAVALVLDDGPVRGGVPSTVVACLDDAEPQVLRQGALAAERILAASRLERQP
jgi:L-threonylcarbamoyladenylate synthase